MHQYLFTIFDKKSILHHFVLLLVTSVTISICDICMMFTRPKVGNDVAASSQTSPTHTCHVKAHVGFKDLIWYMGSPVG